MHGGSIGRRKELVARRGQGVLEEGKPIKTKKIMTYMYDNCMTKLIIL